MNADVQSGTENATVAIDAIELDSNMGEFRLAAPAKLSTGPWAKARRTGTLPLYGNVHLRGHVGNLDHLARLLRACAVPDGLELKGKARPADLFLNFSFQDSAIQAELQVSKLPAQCVIGPRINEHVGLTIEKKLAATFKTDSDPDGAALPDYPPNSIAWQHCYFFHHFTFFPSFQTSTYRLPSGRVI